MIKEIIGYYGTIISIVRRQIKNELSYIYKKAFQDEFENCTSRHIRRRCKIGLNSAKLNPNLKIIFCLDGLNMSEVLSKADYSGKKITSTELRYAYRNWKELSEKVIFMKGGQRVKAPWEQEPEVWQAYQPKCWKNNLEFLQKRKVKK